MSPGRCPQSGRLEQAFSGLRIGLSSQRTKDGLYASHWLYFLKLDARLKRDHAWGAITAQTHAEQAGRRRGGVSERPKPSLGSWLTWNAGQCDAWKSKVRMIEYIEQLTFNPQLCVLGQGKQLGKVEIAPGETRTAQ